MLVNCVAYQDGRKLADIDKREISDYLKRPGCFVWVALAEATPEELLEMQEEFDLHELAVEDARHGHQRPKIEEYGDSLFVVMHTVEFTPTDDVDGNGVVQRPAAQIVFPVPAHGHLVGKAGRRKDAEKHVYLVAGLREEVLVAVMPETPERPFVAEPVDVPGFFDGVIDADVRNGERYRRNQPEQVKGKKKDQHQAERNDYAECEANGR